MMNDKKKSGFIEKKHTADFSIHVWAEDLETLFLEAANGMFVLMDLKKGNRGITRDHAFELENLDHESLLVGFLNEILFLLENDELFPEELHLKLSENKLQVNLKGCQTRLSYKEIKAVTYHNLHINYDSSEYSVTIVFDV